MRNKGWLRYSLASLTLIGGSLGTLLVACSDDEDGGIVAKDKDSGVPDSSTNTDGPDAAPDATPPDLPDAGTNAKMQLVNAVTDFGPNNPVGAMRLCYGLGAAGTVAPLPPLPDRKSSEAQPYPGVYIGTGGAVQGTGIDLSPIAITPYVMNAQSLAERGLVKPDAGDSSTCTDIFVADAGGALVEGVDYWKLPVIPAGTFAKEKSFILVLTGCTGDSTSTEDKCGPNFKDVGPNGNLKVTIHEIDRATAIEADKIGAQFIHASAAGASALGVGGIQVIPGFIKTANDPLTFMGITGDGTADGGAPVAVGQKTDLAQVSDVDVATDSFIANPSAANTALTLQQIQQLSYGANVPTGGEYRKGAAFTFIAVGDPAEPPLVGDQFNTKVFHFIALPNDPTIQNYTP